MEGVRLIKRGIAMFTLNDFVKFVKFVLPSRRFRMKVEKVLGPLFFGKKVFKPAKQRVELIFWEQKFKAGKPELKK